MREVCGGFTGVALTVAGIGIVVVTTVIILAVWAVDRR